MSVRTRFMLLAVALAAACGLDVRGIGPDALNDASTATMSDGGSEEGSTPAAPDGEAGLVEAGPEGGCVSADSFCDTCDPALVLCVRLTNGMVVDDSRYHRKIDINGQTTVVQTNGTSFLLSDGGAAITVPSGPPPDPLSEVTLEIIARARMPTTVRYGLIDREGPGGIAFFLQPDGSLRCGDGNFLSAAGIDDGGLAHRACVVTRGRSESFLRGQRVASWDGGDPSLTAATVPFSLLSNSPSGDPFIGEVVSIRIYSRAKNAAELAAAAKVVP